MCECEIVTDLDNDCTKYKLLSMSKFMMDKSLINNRLFKVTILHAWIFFLILQILLVIFSW